MNAKCPRCGRVLTFEEMYRNRDSVRGRLFSIRLTTDRPYYSETCQCGAVVKPEQLMSGEYHLVVTELVGPQGVK